MGQARQAVAQVRRFPAERTLRRKRQASRCGTDHHQAQYDRDCLGNGIPPTSGINLINNNSLGGPLLDPISLAPNGLEDYNADGARCLRNLFTGTDLDALRVLRGIAEVKRNGNLQGKPAIIVHGRADNLVPVNHSSRPYYGYAHLKNSAPLPPSQLVRTTPRGGTPGFARAITLANVPPIAANPASSDRILFIGNMLTIPE